MSDHFTLPFNIKDSGIKFELHKDAVHKLSNTGFQFGFPESGFGQMVYYRTYSRIMSNGQQEQWLDTVLRVINGVMTIRKWWFVMHHLRWNEYSNQQVAYEMADSMLKMHWLPPGRGLWAMGSDYMYERGSASLYNCAFVEVNDLVEDSCWLMDMSMNGCFTKDTKISLMNGTEVSFEDLVKNYSDKQFWVYSYDIENKRIVPGLAHSPRITRRNAELVKVILDNNESIRCTKDHKFLLRNGEYKEAQYLQPEDSLMPLYRAKQICYGYTDYEHILENNKAIPTHMISAEVNDQTECSICSVKLPDSKHCIRHHKDFNRFNNDPSNIQWVTWKEHGKIHGAYGSTVMTKLNKENWADESYREKTTKMLQELSSSKEGRQRTTNRNKVNWSKPEYREKMLDMLQEMNNSQAHKDRIIKRNRDTWSNSEKREQLISSIRKPKSYNPGHTRYHKNLNVYNPECEHCIVEHPMNHKVVSVEFLTEREDVYDITVEKYHNFALTSGVFVHNCGVGFGITSKQWKLYTPSKRKKIEFVVPDSREGWVESVRLLLKSYTTPASASVKFDYSKIRKPGTRLQGFGGTASGPAPLIELHERISLYCEEYQSGVIDSTRLVADFQNAIGACVVAGNIRRSAEIALGDVFDETFMNLKNYNRFPDRVDIGWMSNNSVRLSHKDHFDELHRISNLIVDNGEPGILNMKNIQKYARLDILKPDLATGINPCIAEDTKIIGYDPITGRQFITEVRNLENKEFLVPAVDKDKFIKLKKARAFVTKTDAQLIRLHLDDNTHLDVTSNHIMILKSGEEIEAGKLQIGDSLMPMNLSKDKYWNYYLPRFGRAKVAKLLMEYKTGIWSDDHVHHIDENRYNDLFSNLEIKDSKLHMQEHMKGDKNPIFKLKKTGKFESYKNSNEFYSKPVHNRIEVVKNVSSLRIILGRFIDWEDWYKEAKMKGSGYETLNYPGISWIKSSLGGLYGMNYAALVLESQGIDALNSYLERFDSKLTDLPKVTRMNMLKVRSQFAPVFNHKISKIELLPGSHRVFDLNVEDLHNFAIVTSESPNKYTGVFVHNCAEIPLESFEVCNLSEVFPTRCKDKATFFAALKAATLYSSTVSLYPTHSAQTNEVVARNRRIGVSISGIAQWIDTFPTNSCIRWMKEGYDIVEAENKRLASEAGVVPSVRLTTVKPSGSISQVAGVTSGMHFPAFEYALRRIIVSKTNSLYELLLDAGYRCEPHIKGVRNTEFNPETMKVYDKYNKPPKNGEESYNINTESDDTVVFEVPIQFKGARPATNVSAWEQFALLAMLQRNWADNSVSATIYFNKNGEHKQINHMLSQFVSQIKSVSVLPHSDLGAYNQMPYEGITKEVFEQEASRLKPIMWDRLKGSDGIQEKYCTNDTCVLQ